MIGRYLFKFSKSKLGTLFVGIVFSRLSHFLPVSKVYQNNDVLCFHHPRPVDTPHVLVVPKHSVTTLRALTQEKNASNLLLALFKGCQRSIEEIGITEYTIFANGGHRQEVLQVHFHLTSPKFSITKSLSHSMLVDIDSPVIDVNIYSRAATENYMNFVCIFKGSLPVRSNRWSSDISLAKRIPLVLRYLEDKYSLSARGYTVILQSHRNTADIDDGNFVLQLKAGELH